MPAFDIARADNRPERASRRDWRTRGLLRRGRVDPPRRQHGNLPRTPLRGSTTSDDEAEPEESHLTPPGHRQPAHAAYAILADFLAARDPLRPADAIIAFGGRDMAVADQAARLHREGRAPWIVATGGVPFDARRSEAEAFADRMAARGIPRERILIESRSRHTGENVAFALDLLQKRTGGLRTVIAVPWPFAARRAAATLRRHAPGVGVVCAPDRTGPGGRRPFGPRAVRFVLAELDRLDRYVHAGFIEAQRVPDRVRSAGAVLTAELDLAMPATAPARATPAAAASAAAP